jgi:hypothetical protein
MPMMKLHLRPAKGRLETGVVRDRGTGFIEILVSVVILGTAGIALLTALAASARSARVHREIADAQAWLATTGDAVSDVESDYVDCDTEPDPAVIAATYEATIIAPVTAAPSAPMIDIIAVEFWDSSSGSFGAACRYAPEGDRLQKITLQTTIDGDIRTLAVVKRPALEPTHGTAPPPPPVAGGAVVPTPTPGLEGP